MTRRIAILAPEPIRLQMAGMGIRALEIAAALAPRFDVRLLVPNAAGEAPARPGVTVVEAPPGSPAFHREVRACEAALVSGHAASEVFVAAPHLPVAVDWYDPFLVENFHYRESLGEDVEANDRRAWNLALARADFFLCASEEQRLFYAGMLVLSGRIDADFARIDPGAGSLLAVVPFGASPPPPADASRIRAAVGAEGDDPILFFGGLYDWHDVDPLVEAWPDLLAEFPRLRILFSENPNRGTTPQKVYEQAVAASESRGWKDRSFFFLPWSPYPARGALYGASRLSVCLCRPGLETELSFRTRLLDAASGGLPSVSVNGGALGAGLAAAGAGWTATNAASLREAIARPLRDETLRQSAAKNASAFARRFSWPEVVAPVSRFFENPRVSNRLPFPEPRPRPAFRLLRRGRP